MKTILFQLNHPAHYHLFKNPINILKESGHNIIISIKHKDILMDLLDGTHYYIISDSYRKNDFFSIAASVAKRDIALFKLIKKVKPDLMVGTSPEIGQISKATSTPAIFFGEDDVLISKTMFIGALTCYPLFRSIVSPEGCNNSIWNSKTVFYKGFQKLSYLHPNWFKPDIRRVLSVKDNPYFIIRLSKLGAYHDINAEGITDQLAITLIKILRGYGQILITSERDLPRELEEYRFSGNIHDIHHYLAFADLYIGDSQSMAVEAAILGTPGIRYNNFIGKISVLEELEKKYQLGFGIKSNSEEALIDKVRSILNNSNIRSIYRERRNKLLADKIDVASFFAWLIGNYPNSIKEFNENPSIQSQFQ